MPWNGDGSFEIALFYHSDNLEPFLSSDPLGQIRALYKLYKNTVVWLES